jgi:hypothetical protein
MENGPDFELLKDAYAIVDGIPETAIDLDKLCSARGASLVHGTVCSVAGWLAQHPTFTALGLALSEDGERLSFNDEAQHGTPAEVLAQVFRLPLPQAEHLFGSRATYTLGDDSGLSDKRLWLREVREFLKEHGQLDEEFEESLNTRAPFTEPADPEQVRAL